jgi:hypothetical protein
MIKMRQVVVRYTVKPGRAAENEELVRAVYEELEDVQPDGFQYGTFRLEDGLSFVHVALDERDRRSPLIDLEAFKRFQENLDDRVQEGPVVTPVSPVGSYRLIAGSA